MSGLGKATSQLRGNGGEFTTVACAHKQSFKQDATISLNNHLESKQSSCLHEGKTQSHFKLSELTDNFDKAKNAFHGKGINKNKKAEEIIILRPLLKGNNLHSLATTEMLVLM